MPGAGLILRDVHLATPNTAALSLSQMFNLNQPRYFGQAVRHVVLRAQTFRGLGQAQVYVDGRPIGPQQTIGSFMRDYIFMMPPGYVVLGQNAYNIEIRLFGAMQLERMGLQLDAGGVWVF